MDCPKCGSEMAPVRFADVTVDRCVQCGGLWFDRLEYEDLKKLRGAAKVVDCGDPQTGREMNAVPQADCPTCHARMIRLVVPDQPHIAYEQCSLCDGVFMDAGEFADFAKLTVREYLRNLLP